MNSLHRMNADSTSLEGILLVRKWADFRLNCTPRFRLILRRGHWEKLLYNKLAITQKQRETSTMTNVIEVHDCRGYKVICTEEIWYGKILVSRPWMNGWENIVSEAIKAPSFICGDKDHQDRHAYYMLRIDKKNRYVKVIVKFDARNEGFVISAYPTDSGKSGEFLIWTPSKG